MSELFLSVLNMSLTASYVILFVILVRLILKKAPKFISYALWGVVAFRLIIPFSFENMFSLMPRTMNVAPIPYDIIYQQSPQINSGIEVVDLFVSQSLPAPTVGVSVNPLQIYTEIGAYIWIMGIMVLLIYSLVSVFQLKRQLKNAQVVEQNIYEVNNLKTPFVLGIIRPKVYLPVGLNHSERSYILLHERTHISRKDHIIKVLAFLILSLHWFNPLVWIAFMLMSTDMELSCDEQVLKKMNTDNKKPYANSLLSLAIGRHILNGSPLAFGEGNVRGRIKNVMNYKKPKLWVMIVSVIVLTGVGIALLSNPVGGEQKELIYRADVDGNGHEESIFIDKSQIDNMLVTLSICNENGKEIWSDELSTSHAGWGSLFLCKMDDKQYLLDYNPYINQGYATYRYTLFTLEDGKEKVYRNNSLEFDINGIAELNPPKMVVFADEVNELLRKSVLLLSTEGGEYCFGPTVAEPFFERYSWLDLAMELYDSNDDLETRLVKYNEYALSSRKLYEERYFPMDRDESKVSLEPIAAEWSYDQNMGADFPFLDYASDKIVIFHGYFGLFVYDLHSQKIIRSLNLAPIDCQYTQGDNYCNVSVSADGNTVQLHPAANDNMYVYSILENTLIEAPYQLMKERFDGLLSITDVMDFDKMGNSSSNTVKFGNDEFGYLKASEWNVGSLTYVRGNKIYRLFDNSANK